jgi:hypothetical protein
MVGKDERQVLDAFSAMRANRLFGDAVSLCGRDQALPGVPPRLTFKPTPHGA